MELNAVVTGKVKNIKPFGAFIDLGDGQEGLLRVSEIDESYVKNIRDYINVGDEVKVRVTKIDENNRISLSMKEFPKTPVHRERNQNNQERRQESREPRPQRQPRERDEDVFEKEDSGRLVKVKTQELSDSYNKFKKDLLVWMDETKKRHEHYFGKAN